MDTSSLLTDLHAQAPLVGPSLLACDFGHLATEVRRLEEAGARIFHLDVMDGHFVPNLSIGVPIVEAVRRATELPLDVHLMISEPARYLEVFREAGADLITIHAEVVEDLSRVLRRIRELGAAAGVALNPDTPAGAIEEHLSECDLILAMSVMPGFGGQQFQEVALEKLRWLHDRVGGNVLLSVDGGVNAQTIGRCARAGAGLFVVGTALLGHEDYRQRLAELTTLAKSFQDDVRV